MVTNLKAMSFGVGIEPSRPAQSIVDIFGRPKWWCDVGHCVVVSENFRHQNLCALRVKCKMRKNNHKYVIELSK